MSISLKKNETLNLSKDARSGLNNVRMGLGWDAMEKKGMFGKTKQVSIDLDASAILIGAGQVQEIVSFSKLSSTDGSVRHTGDNLTGAGDGDDESINVSLSSVPGNIDTIVFVVNSYSGQSFSDVKNAFVRLVDSEQGDAEIARFELTSFGNYTGMIMASLKRQGGDWHLNAIGDPANGRTARHISQQASQH